MKLLVSPNKIDDIDKLIDFNINSFLYGIKDLSLYQEFYIDINELKDIIKKYPNIEIFISLNKLMHNNDIDYLKETLTTLDKLNIKGILYDDVAILNITEELNLNLNLIWASTHLVTNYHTINTLKDKIKGAFISSEITLKEIIDIRSNTDCKLIVPIYGYQIMTTSYRTLLSNYLNFVKVKKEDDKYYLKDKDGMYPIIEDDNGTHILTNNILNGIKEIDELKNIDYLYLSSLNIDSDTFIKVVKIYQDKIDNKEIDIKEIDLLTPNNDQGFFYKESYFKVNNNE